MEIIWKVTQHKCAQSECGNVWADYWRIDFPEPTHPFQVIFQDFLLLLRHDSFGVKVSKNLPSYSYDRAVL